LRISKIVVKAIEVREETIVEERIVEKGIVVQLEEKLHKR
jgi:hypothetical protein